MPAAPQSGDADHVPSKGPVRVFIAFAPRDGDLFQELADHLAPLKREGLIKVWHRGMVGPGEDVEAAAKEHLAAAQVITVLLSSALLAGDSEMQELAFAIKRLRAGTVRVVPILARPVDLRVAILGGLQVLPRDGRAVTTWADPHAAWAQVATEIGFLVSSGQERAVHAVPIVGTPLIQEGAAVESSSRLHFSLNLRWRRFAMTISLAALAMMLSWRLWIWNPPTPVFGPREDLALPLDDLGVPRDLEAPAPPPDLAVLDTSSRVNATIKRKVKQIICEQLGVSPDRVRPEARFRELTTDKFAVAELTLGLETEFEIKIPDEVIDRFKTVQDVTHYLEARLRPRPAPPLRTPPRALPIDPP